MSQEAIRAFEDSLMEDRTEEVQKLLKQTQQAKKKADDEAYMSPEAAEQAAAPPLLPPIAATATRDDTASKRARARRPQARQEGNELFKAGKYPDAIAKYTDAMKRNPKDHVPYSNRAACYQKLMEWQARPLPAPPQPRHRCSPTAHALLRWRQLAIKDADHCITMDPTFVKGWSRKAGIHFFLKEYHKALDAYNEILKLDPENAEAKSQIENVLQQVNAANQTGEVDKERQARAMADPEIQQILSDPIMRQVLQDFSETPKAAQAHQRNPEIMAKIQKLVNAGVVQVR